MFESLLEEFRAELRQLADWWCSAAIDEQNGGFIGEISVAGERCFEADKGIILNTRLLWFFSEVARFTDEPRYRASAYRAFDVIAQQFHDAHHGGLVWALNARGAVIDNRKQVYAQAFGIYALSAFYQLTGETRALALAIELFELLESHAHPCAGEGYLEAFSGSWQALRDTRLSDKDLHAHKSMNTHLHLLEAYSGLLQTSACPQAEPALHRLVGYFETHIINPANSHLRLFMNSNWGDLSQSLSYGHDIECSWLLWEACSLLKDVALQRRLETAVLNIASALQQEGIDAQGALQDGFCFKSNRTLEQRIWWVQSEALVGFLNAYRLTGDAAYFDTFVSIWAFIKTYHKDNQHGEWHWYSTLDQPAWQEYKLGFWKGPYHNGRAMMAVCTLLNEINKKTNNNP